MSAERKDVTLNLPPNAAKALTWVLQEALEISAERIPGLSIEDATSEITDLSALASLLSEIGGAPEAVSSIARQVTSIAQEIEDRTALKLG